jgi:hypothetical protein
MFIDSLNLMLDYLFVFFEISRACTRPVAAHVASDGYVEVNQVQDC